MTETTSLSVTTQDETFDNVHNMLIALKLYEERIKVVKAQLREQIKLNSSTTTPWGKVTLSEASRVTVNGSALYDLLLERDVDPKKYGTCSVSCNERDLTGMIVDGVLTADEATALVKVSNYETFRVTPNKDAKEFIYSDLPLRLESDND